MANDKIQTTVVPLSERKDVRQMIQVAISFSVLIALWSGLRLYSRRIRSTLLNVEDGLFFVSVAAWYALVVALFLRGIGYHMEQLQNFHIARLTQSVLAIQGLYGLAMCTSKWSVLWMLKRIFAVREFQIAAWGIIVLQAAWMVMTLLIGLLICRPIQKNWDPTAEGSCGDQIAGYRAVSIVNVVIDLMMCILPMPMLFKLQIRGPYKLALVGIFSIGIVTVIFAILRLQSLQTVDFNDFAWSVPDVIVWTYAEVGIAIIVSCSPLLRPVFDKMFKFILQTTTNRSKSLEPSRDSQNYLKSGSNHVRSRLRNEANGFTTIEGSDDGLELTGVGGTLDTRVVRAWNEDGDPKWAREDRTLSKATVDGIMVESCVSQTVYHAK